MIHSCAKLLICRTTWARAGLPLVILLALASTLHPQFYFGRNKIQYEQFDWQVLTTSHFHIYYYPEEETLARAAAHWAEAAFDEFEQKFNHTLSRRVPLIIYSNHLHFQQTNITPYLVPEGVGGFFEFVKGRVVLPNNGSLYDFHRVVRHELVHVFMHAKLNAKAREVGVWDQRHPPIWFTEGLAEWWATGWDTQAEMIIRDALLHDHLVPLEYLTLGGAGFLAYKEGQSFLQYLEETYGADRIRQVMEEFYDHETFEDALAAVTGDSYRNITKQWRLVLKQRAAEALIKESLPGQESRALTQIGANVSPAVYQNADGKDHVIYLSTRDGYTNVYRRALDDPEEHLVIRGERTPELESLHFLQSGLSVSADNILAFVTKSFERDVLRLIDLGSLDEVGEFSHPELTTIRSPEWSPDGQRIVFSAQSRGGLTDLYLWTITDTTAARLTHDAYLDQEPCFSPDGQAIVFSSDRSRPAPDGGTNLFLYDLQSNQIRMVTTGPNQDQRPRWSLDYPRTIYFVSDRSGTPNIWRIVLPEKVESTTTVPAITPVTDLHTGVLDIQPLPQDSLLLTTFQDFNFQLQLAPNDLVKSPQVKGETLSGSNSASWLPPRYEGESGTESHPYRLKYSLDIAQTAVAYDPIFGFLGGAQVGISDVLGNRYYHFLLANTAQTSSQFLDRFNFAVTAANLTRRVNYAWGLFRFANDYYNPYQDQIFFYEKSLGIRGAMNYPLNVFKRVELSGSLWRSQKSFYGPDPNTDDILLSNYLSFVHDNSLWLPTGPIDGWRLRITGGLTYNFTSSQIHNYTALFDNRTYLRFARHFTFAQRTMLWVNAGDDIRRFFIGGSWGMRGYGITEVYGRKYFMLNQELRFPFAQSLVLNLGSMAIGMAPIRGALFLDVGKAWEDDWDDPPIKGRSIGKIIGSYGLGLRGLFMGGIVLRLDIGRRTDFHSKDSRWFSQFFFGWDY
ncbi:MAG: PD40 domain-containing protein [Fidelibacterota bacterium]|nr:MAG: PD40 domain-containing protein [Candidatus Neomarinimicrobiota bacterium]